MREVDEEVRREKLARFWSRYGIWIGVAVLLFLAAVAGFLYWREREAARAAAEGERLTAALNALEAGGSGAQTQLAELQNSDAPGYRALAKLALAALAVRDNDTKRALSIYREMAGDSSLAEPFRNLALLKAVRLQFDQLPVAQLEQQLKPLAQPGGPWFGPAGELLALAYLREGKRDLAAPLFAAIATDQTQPESLRLRVGEFAATLGASVEDAGEDRDPAAASPAAPAAKQ